MNEASALVAYAHELERRMNDAGSGPVGVDAEALLANALRALRQPRSRALKTPADALELLGVLGASAWLVRHHELVVEAMSLLCEQVSRLGLRFDRRLALLGAALHDAGKILHPEEMSQGGSAHEAAGERLLLDQGVAPEVTRFCVTHAAWSDARCQLEDVMVALADKLWKGKRNEALEAAFVERVVAEVGGERWSVFAHVDAICESIAGGGPDRLQRSAV